MDDAGYPIHGHLAWGDAAWWTRQFEQAGFTREVEIERAFHRKYDGYMEKRSPARRAYFVFGKKASARRRAAVVARIAAPSKLLRLVDLGPVYLARLSRTHAASRVPMHAAADAEDIHARRS